MCYCEMPAIQERVNIKAARKPHRCDECRKLIEVGQPYQRYDSLYDGAWQRSAFCVACQAAWEALWRSDDCACEVPIGEVWNALDDFGVATPYWRYGHYRERSAA